MTDIILAAAMAAAGDAETAPPPSTGSVFLALRGGLGYYASRSSWAFG